MGIPDERSEALIDRVCRLAGVSRDAGNGSVQAPPV